MNPDLIVEADLGNGLVSRDFYDTDPGATETTFFLPERPYLFGPGNATPRNVAITIYDECTGAGENFTLQSVKVNAVAMC